MTQVTVNGNTYSDDGSTPNDMNAGGFRTNFLKMVSDTLASIVNSIGTVSGYLSAAQTQANAAAASAASAFSAPGTSATSTSVLTIAIGAQNLVIQSGKSLVVGMQVIIANTASPANWMAGTITSYNAATGALGVAVTNIQGAAAGVSTWTVSLIGAPGVTGVLNELKGAPIASAATINLDAATGNLVHITGGTPITAMTLAAGSRRTVVFDGVLTLTNSATLQCAGAASITTAPGDMATVYGDGGGITIVRDYIKANGMAATVQGAGGQIGTTGSMTLTVASAGAQLVTPTGPGAYVTLPDATTCQKGAMFAVITNSSPDYDYGVKDGAGNKLGWIRPNTTALIGLADNSAVAGVWNLFGTERTGITAQLLTTTAAGGPNVSRYAIDATRTMLIYGNPSTTTYAIVYDASVNQFGSPMSLGTANFAASCAGVLAGQVMVVTVQSSGTAGAVYTLTATGTAVNLAATGSFTLATVQYNVILTIAPAGTSGNFVIGYSRDVNSYYYCLRGVSTANGLSISVGAETIVQSGYQAATYYAALYSISNSVVVSLNTDGNGNFVVKPYTVTGNALAVGTQASTTLGGITWSPKFLPQQATGRIPILYSNGSGQSLGLVSVSGTVASISSVQTGGANTTETNTDVVFLSSTKFATAGVNGNNTLVNVFTDTAGTITAGSSVNFSTSGSGSSPCIVYSTATQIRVAWTYNSSTYMTTLDVSGASPVVTFNIVTQGAFNVPLASDMSISVQRTYNRSYRFVLGSNNVAYTLGYGSSGAPASFAPNSIQINKPLLVNSGSGTPGAAANDTWFVGSAYIQHVEAA